MKGPKFEEAYMNPAVMEVCYPADRERKKEPSTISKVAKKLFGF